MLSFLPNLRAIRVASSSGFLITCTFGLLSVEALTSDPSGDFNRVLHVANERFGDVPFFVFAFGFSFFLGAILQDVAERLFARLRNKFAVGPEVVFPFEEDEYFGVEKRKVKFESYRKTLTFFSYKGASDLGMAIFERSAQLTSGTDTDDYVSSETDKMMRLKMPTFIRQDISEGGFDAMLLLKAEKLSERRTQLITEAALRETIVLTASLCFAVLTIRFATTQTLWAWGCVAVALAILAVLLITQASTSRQHANDTLAAAFRTEDVELPMSYPLFR